MVIIGRALRLRCPNCGIGRVLAPLRPGRTWGAVLERCSGCGFRFERSDDGYFSGSMLTNLAIAEGLFAIGFAAVVLITWPDVPWDALTYGAALGMLLSPILLYPVSKVLWLAFDVLLRPVHAGELSPDSHVR